MEMDSNLVLLRLEARHDPAHAPTAIYLGGGPGYTSLDSMSSFPCTIGADGNSSTINPFSWNNHVNMLYIDQPAGTGFSYSTRANGTLNVVTDEFTPLEHGKPLRTNATTLAATLDPSNSKTVLNTTNQAARVLWQFSQIFFQECVSTMCVVSEQIY